MRYLLGALVMALFVVSQIKKRELCVTSVLLLPADYKGCAGPASGICYAEQKKGIKQKVCCTFIREFGTMSVICRRRSCLMQTAIPCTAMTSAVRPAVFCRTCITCLSQHYTLTAGQSQSWYRLYCCVEFHSTKRVCYCEGVGLGV